MIQIRKSDERGHFNFGWLDTYHTFSFGDYYNPNQMGFRALRVINEDRVQPSEGFPTHGHRDMEIITYILEGELEHKDSMGTGSVIRPGEVQRMSAGSGVAHSECNLSKTEPVHLLQIWILPEAKNLTPSYEQKRINLKSKPNEFCLIASHRPSKEIVRIHQDTNLFASMLKKGKSIRYAFKPGRYGWLQIAYGRVELNDQLLTAGDGASLSGEKSLTVTAKEDSEFLLFDLT